LKFPALRLGGGVSKTNLFKAFVPAKDAPEDGDCEHLTQVAAKCNRPDFRFARLDQPLYHIWSAMKIYFAGSIRGGRDDAILYRRIIALLSEYGEVLTEHIGSDGLTPTGEDTLLDRDIYARDLAWLTEADVVVAEVTTPSHGVGYEIGQAEAMGKPVLCIHRSSAGRRLSAMLAGNPALQCETYETTEELAPTLKRFLQD
jgi:nucleoside 2-deoxyribosyltransferase